MKKIIEDKSLFFFLDLDGTLFNNKSSVKKSTSRFLKKREDWAISTGRDISHLSKVKSLPKYIIVNNGSQIYRDGELIYSKTFTKQELKKILDKWEGRVVNFKNGKSVKKMDVNISKISLYPCVVDKSLFKYFSYNIYEDHIELMPKGVSKGLAEAIVIAELKSEGFKNFIHIGDSENDISAKEHGIKLVSMKNGNKSIKLAADYVSKYKNTNGVHKTINEIRKS